MDHRKKIHSLNNVFLKQVSIITARIIKIKGFIIDLICHYIQLKMWKALN